MRGGGRSAADKALLGIAVRKKAVAAEGLTAVAVKLPRLVAAARPASTKP